MATAGVTFIGNREFTGLQPTKKAAPFGATLFKEARNGRKSEMTGLAPLGGQPAAAKRDVENAEESDVAHNGCGLFITL